MKRLVLGRNKRQNYLIRVIGSLLVRMRVIWVMMLAALLLSGCVKYDAGVHFEGEHRGEIVQHIKVGEQLTSFSGESAQEWLDSIERRARQLQGKTRRVSKQELTVTIPFYSGAELEDKFNQFFNPTDKKGSKAATVGGVDLPDIKSHLSVNQGNFIFWVRNKLTYDLDLRSLAVLSNNGNAIVSPGSLINLEFSLTTPGGAKSVETGANAINPVSQKGRQLVWTLKPGEINHLEAVFWLPSPLGIGALIIALFVALGIYLKEKAFPGVTPPPIQTPLVSE